MAALWQAIVRFFGPAARAIRGYINVIELMRILIAAVLAGSVSWIALLQLLSEKVGDYTTDMDLANIISMAISLILAIVEFVRRFRQGDDPVPTRDPVIPPPSQAEAPTSHDVP